MQLWKMYERQRVSEALSKSSIQIGFMLSFIYQFVLQRLSLFLVSLVEKQYLVLMPFVSCDHGTSIARGNYHPEPASQPLWGGIVSRREAESLVRDHVCYYMYVRSGVVEIGS